MARETRQKRTLLETTPALCFLRGLARVGRPHRRNQTHLACVRRFTSTAARKRHSRGKSENLATSGKLNVVLRRERPGRAGREPALIENDTRRLGAIPASGFVLSIGGFSDAVFSIFAAFLAGFPVRDPVEVELMVRTLCRDRA